MIRIASLRDLDAAVATAAFGPAPPVVADTVAGELDTTGIWYASRGQWHAINFSTDPSASYALERRMGELGYRWTMTNNVFRDAPTWVVSIDPMDDNELDELDDHGHLSRFVAMCLAALAALGVELELVEEWDKQ